MNGSKFGARHSVQGAFVFVLLGLFAVMSTLMVLLGARMYRATVDRSEANNAYRVLSAYVRSMIRAGDSAGSVGVEEYDGCRALALREDIDGEDFVTWIYGWDGQLWEQFTEADAEFDPEAGTAICPVAGFDPSVADGLVSVAMTDAHGEPCDVRVAVRG